MLRTSLGLTTNLCRPQPRQDHSNRHRGVCLRSVSLHPESLEDLHFPCKLECLAPAVDARLVLGLQCHHSSRSRPLWEWPRRRCATRTCSRSTAAAVSQVTSSRFSNGFTTEDAAVSGQISSGLSPRIVCDRNTVGRGNTQCHTRCPGGECDARCLQLRDQLTRHLMR